jgi:NhaP-type Na+/H+ or K+/H+ antiporter
MDWITSLKILSYFFYLLSASVVVGAAFGLGISVFFKKFESFMNSPIKETSIILLVGYISYLVAELL